MLEIEKLLTDYGIDEADINNIRQAAPMMEKRRDELAEFHYSVLLKKTETARFFADKGTLERARDAFVEWFLTLLKAEFNHAYYLKLYRIGSAHERIGMPPNLVNVQMSHIRAFVADAIHKDFDGPCGAAARTIASFNKALDMNMDMMTRSYREAELKTHFFSYRLDAGALSVAKWFVNGFNLALVFGLLVTGLAVLGLAVYDLSHLAISDGIEKGMLRGLGTLLVLWVVIELLDTQIKHMKGSSFAIKVFVSVALVAELRRLLITSIEHAPWQEELILVAGLLALGAIYWMVSRIEKS
jgi:uncharacterized membrane protein (DUF373 family)